jgi:hypothetical protein
MRSESVTVGRFPVQGKNFILCRVSYYKGRGYFFEADPCEDMGDGVIAISLGVLHRAGRMELLKEAKRFSQKTFEELASHWRNSCAAEAPCVMRHVAEATERVTREITA